MKSTYQAFLQNKKKSWTERLTNGSLVTPTPGHCELACPQSFYITAIVSVQTAPRSGLLQGTCVTDLVPGQCPTWPREYILRYQFQTNKTIRFWYYFVCVTFPSISILTLGCRPCPIRRLTTPGSTEQWSSMRLCLAGQRQTGHILWHYSSCILTTSFEAFLVLWCRESLNLWQIWYSTWHAIDVQTIWAAGCEGLS